MNGSFSIFHFYIFTCSCQIISSISIYFDGRKNRWFWSISPTNFLEFLWWNFRWCVRNLGCKISGFRCRKILFVLPIFISAQYSFGASWISIIFSWIYQYKQSVKPVALGSRVPRWPILNFFFGRLNSLFEFIFQFINSLKNSSNPEVCQGE